MIVTIYKQIDHNVPDEVKKSIGKVLDKNGLSLDEMGEDQLYYADFIQLGRFFFDAYPLKPLTQEAISKIREAANGDKVKLEAVLNTYTAKSNWDRYFAEKIPVDELQAKWQKLYGYRYQVG